MQRWGARRFPQTPMRGKAPEGEAMVEFAETYGLWIALAGVFIAMHWFGMGCCGGRQRQRQRQGQGQGTEGGSDQGPRDNKAREVTPKSKESCH